MKTKIKFLKAFMKSLSSSIKIFSLCFCVSVLKVILLSTTAFTQSNINYQAGTVIDIQSGASVCADSVIIAGTLTGGGTICGLNYTLNLIAFLEGYYNSSSDLMVSDTVTVSLRDTISPFAVVDTYSAVLSSNGTGTFFFPNAQNGKGYYLQVTHKGSIETWSIITTPFNSGLLTYIFSDAITRAYGNNMKQVDASPVVFALFGGDSNQDGIIDSGDQSQIENDVTNSVSGYVPTDLNGDEFVDGADLSIAENNVGLGVVAIVP